MRHPENLSHERFGCDGYQRIWGAESPLSLRGIDSLNEMLGCVTPTPVAPREKCQYLIHVAQNYSSA